MYEEEGDVQDDDNTMTMRSNQIKKMMIVKRNATKCCFELFGYNGSRKFVLQKKLLQDQILNSARNIEKTGVDTERLQSMRLETEKHKAVFETEQGIAVTNALQQETEGTGEQ